ncbi:CRISPR-associated helicase/endonuclease Cas3 [Clostridium botulinum]|uniref:CRISPR-associated helicase/endonuclease Cas3 n=1 Tax=Clostridium botulinum TaxID=1491 RepID=UPI00077472B4|nr:CRISPR-associated helicase/endonuclease Cas3 [Clostridium botulinum]MBY6950091.1 CRISPR-associated helicase/endonuclease Cas3 [Clostridium botulinum]MCR1138337.1 CRISPR-associated helicase/endonuclease Cas3 [Clostridium botulinum]NEZ80299.1 CRISPR-associated helicase/endonuclease Cas3 [Clostridium botulinum]NFA14967.1 CRISPR-associated helicase/endonuclease Cas3 [Clostridium botulinum]NFA52598.1 CRISPR-associated helicase/endonuclease Cas3 [Clostridium botulinum]
MYFNNTEKVNLEKLIKNSDKIYAHINNEKKETLKEHLDLSLKYLNKICKSKSLDNVFLNFENNLLVGFSDEGKKLYKEMILNTIYMHDIGKINCNFQFRKMKNEYFKNEEGLKSNNSNHSMLSSVIYINHFLGIIKDIKSSKDRNLLIVFMLLNSYIISKHHGTLDSFEEFKRKLVESDGEGKRLYTTQLSAFQNIYKEKMLFNGENEFLKGIFNVNKSVLSNSKGKDFSINLYIYERFLASLLLSCDYYATSNFTDKKEINDFGEINDIEKFYKYYKSNEIYKIIREYEENNYGNLEDFSNIDNINILRNELFLDAEKALINNMDKNIFYLEAPTGSGKSNVAFNLSFKIIENFKNINKIFYVYPFNTLIEQNIKTLEKIFKNKNVMEEIAIINSVVPIKMKSKKEINMENLNKNEDSDVLNADYRKALLDRQFLHYPIVLTTHVSIFNYLFGTSKDDIFPLCQIANSIIVLDEIQSYKNKIWKEIITFLNRYSKLLNIKIIIMSATLPNLNKLIDEKIETVNLIEDREKYFENSIFKDRVKVDYSLLDEESDIKEVLFNHVIDTSKMLRKNILIEFIKKQTAMDFYKKLIEYNETLEECEKSDIELMTGDDNRVDRNKIIEKIKSLNNKKDINNMKSNKNIILIATQVIEAGVDIDMDMGYKDISMLDSEEQFLGRINRSCTKNNSKVYFFDLDSAAKIYVSDIRKEKHINLTSKHIREILINKDFQEFYDYVIKALNKRAKEHNESSFKSFMLEKVNKLNFKEIEERMKLIDELYENSVFLNRKIKLENGEILEGEKVWSEYISILKNNKLDYAKKKVELSKVSANLNYFIYQVNTNDFTYEERIGNIYYIPDGEKYFVEGKFDRENFNKGIGDFI